MVARDHGKSKEKVKGKIDKNVCLCSCILSIVLFIVLRYIIHGISHVANESSRVPNWRVKMNKKICEMVAEKVLEELEKGVAPWSQPWFGSDRFVSHVNGKHYSLLNCILLGKPGEYATFNQISKEGGKVKKGAKSKIVVFWSPVKKEVEEDGEKKEKVFYVLRYYRVFNLNDCENIKKKFLNDDDTKYIHELVMDAESVIDGYCKANPSLKIEREEKSGRAFYRPSEDLIKVPCTEQFKDIEEYYSTLFHEMTHSTGHWSRLERFKENGCVAAFGGEDYGKEELIAELGAAALCGKCGVESKSSFRNSAAYLKGWTDAIRGNPEMIVAAAGKADKAVEYILGEVA